MQHDHTPVSAPSSAVCTQGVFKRIHDILISEDVIQPSQVSSQSRQVGMLVAAFLMERFFYQQHILQISSVLTDCMVFGPGLRPTRAPFRCHAAPGEPHPVSNTCTVVMRWKAFEAHKACVRSESWTWRVQPSQLTPVLDKSAQ